MKEEEISEIIDRFAGRGLSATDLREAVALHLDQQTIQALWSIPRYNINQFIEDCLSGLKLESPFLDLGCGRRNLGSKIRQKYGEKTAVIGIDHYFQVLPDIQARVENLPFPPQSFGTIFCMELLEHVADERIVLDEINRVLRPDGCLLLSLPGLDIPKHEKLPFQPDYRRISLVEAEELLITCGFRNIEASEKLLGNLQINIFIKARK